MSQGCFNGGKVFEKLFHGSLKIDVQVSLRCLEGVSMVFLGCFKGVSMAI